MRKALYLLVKSGIIRLQKAGEVKFKRSWKLLKDRVAVEVLLPARSLFFPLKPFVDHVKENFFIKTIISVVIIL